MRSVQAANQRADRAGPAPASRQPALPAWAFATPAFRDLPAECRCWFHQLGVAAPEPPPAARAAGLWNHKQGPAAPQPASVSFDSLLETSPLAIERSADRGSPEAARFWRSSWPLSGVAG